MGEMIKERRYIYILGTHILLRFGRGFGHVCLWILRLAYITQDVNGACCKGEHSFPTSLVL